MVAGVGFEPHDLRVMSSVKDVFHRLVMCRKPAKIGTFLKSAFFIVEPQNSTFRIVVELLLNSK